MSGTVNISRDIWDDEAFKAEPFTEREAFVWLIMEASWKAREKRFGNVVVSLDRGQLACSIRFMAEAWKWHRASVDRFLIRLKKRDMIETDVETGISVITICKYNEYQGQGNAAETHEKKKPRQHRDSTETNEKKGLIPDTHKEEEPNGSLSPADEIAEAVIAYNSEAERSGWPKVQKLSIARRSALRGRLHECGGIAGWQSALAKAAASDFLCGRSARGDPFRCSFDFLMQQSSFTKLMEGNYDNRTPPSQTRTDNGRGPSGPHHGMVAGFAEVAARGRDRPQ